MEFNGLIAIVLLGTILIVVGVVFNKIRSSKKTRGERLAEFFADYNEKMEGLRKP